MPMSGNVGDPPSWVMKFGGATLDSAARAADLVLRRRSEGLRVAVVVSARSSVTDLLVATAEGRGPGVVACADRLLARHPGVGRDVFDRAGTKEPEAFVALGERFAARWFARELTVRGARATPCDADEVGLRTDGVPWSGTFDLERSRAPVAESVGAILADGRVPVLTGFLGRGPGGRVNLLGRGGSDYSASALGQLLDAAGVELVKAAGPVRTADPSLVPCARPFTHLHYDEAEALAGAGAQVLHPRAVAPARRAAIPLTVRGLGEERPATRIDGARSERGLRAVAVARTSATHARLTVFHPSLPVPPGSPGFELEEPAAWEAGGPGWSSASVPAPWSRRLAQRWHRAVVEREREVPEPRAPMRRSAEPCRVPGGGLLQGAGS